MVRSPFTPPAAVLLVPEEAGFGLDEGAIDVGGLEEDLVFSGAGSNCFGPLGD